MSRINLITEAIVAQGILPLYFNPDEATTIEILKLGSGLVFVKWA